MALQPACDGAREKDFQRYLRSEEHTSELQSPCKVVSRLLLEKKDARPLAKPFSAGEPLERRAARFGRPGGGRATSRARAPAPAVRIPPDRGLLRRRCHLHAPA